jgi:hypothetical protein
MDASTVRDQEPMSRCALQAREPEQPRREPLGGDQRATVPGAAVKRHRGRVAKPTRPPIRAHALQRARASRLKNQMTGTR